MGAVLVVPSAAQAGEAHVESGADGARGKARAARVAAARSCRPVRNPYPGTRYEGTDLTRIRASGVTCARARRVARGAHRKGLGMTPPPSGVRRYHWNGWRVTGDLRGDHDRYVAARGAKRVRWVF
jgi:hypothetical protein